MAGEVDALERLLDYLSQPENQETLDKLLRLLENLDRSGLLDLLIALTEPEVVERLTSILVTTGTMKLVDRLDMLLDKLGRAAAALTEDHGEASLSDILSQLRDPQVRRGLAAVIAALRALGSSA